MAREGLDHIDKSILSILQDDARTSYAKISKELKLSETAVRYRVSKLVKEGVISRFAAILDPRKVGYPLSAIVFVKVRQRMLEETFNTMARYHETSHMVQTTGEYDVIAVIHASGNPHLNSLMSRIRALSGVREASVWMTTGLYKLDFRYKLT